MSKLNCSKSNLIDDWYVGRPPWFCDVGSIAV